MLLIILAAILGFVAVAGVGLVVAGGDPNAARTLKRAQAITSGGPRVEKARAKTPNDPTQRRKALLKTLKEQDRRQRKAAVSLSSRLQQAGLKFNVQTFWIGSGVLGVLVLVLMLFLRQMPLVAIGAAFVAGLGLPRWIIGFLAKRRTKKFTEAFPDAIDVITRGIKSGLPVHECLKIIYKEAPEPLRSEFNILVENIGMGMTIEQALEKMYERMPTTELRFFSIVLAIQSKTGGNLAEALSNLSVVLRARRLMREKIKALSSEAIASAIIIGSMPPGVIAMITVTSPSYMTIMFHDHRGQLMLLGGAMWMATGIFVMRRMINFKF